MNWVKELQTELLGLRAACRSDTGISAAEMVYGNTLKLPGDFFHVQNSQINDPNIYVGQLRQTFSR